MSRAVHRAVSAVAAGGVVAYPTEGVYGLGCAPDCGAAVVRLLRMKRRSAQHGLILVAAHAAQLQNYLRLPGVDAPLWSTWPGPVTWILPPAPGVPAWLIGPGGGVAARISAHPQIQALCRQAGPLISTSANPHGCLPALHPVRVRAYFPRLDYVLSGPLGGLSGPTRICDARTGAVLRPAPSVVAAMRGTH